METEAQPNNNLLENPHFKITTEKFQRQVGVIEDATSNYQCQSFYGK